MAVANAPFVSKFGFKGPGFSVDDQGNIVANSIITATTPDDEVANTFDFVVIESQNAYNIAQAGSGANPTLTLARQRTYVFDLQVPTLRFYIYTNNVQGADTYNNGITHSDGSSGVDAQGKDDGTLRFSVSLTAPDILYYGDTAGNVFGQINIIDPVGQFSSVTINDTFESISPTTGALTVAGGIGVEKDIFVGGTLNVGGTGISNLFSGNNLELEAVNEIQLKIDGSKITTISDSGLSSTIINSTINNTVIGNITPATAEFSTAQVNTLPTQDTDVSNKQYTDSTALALSIAFGL